MVERWRRWVGETTDHNPYIALRIGFALVWLTYDLMDLFYGGTQGVLWLVPDQTFHRAIQLSQLGVIFCEVGLLIGWRARWFAVGALLARGLEAYIFPLNDFLYYCVSVFLLAQSECSNADRGKAVRIWPRDVFVIETAWIYLSTALMKVNTEFLSGGDLYVRQNYLATARDWWFPDLYRQWIAALSHNAILAWMGVIGEAALGAVLVAWWFWPRHRRVFFLAALGLTSAIHAFGAAMCNVFFFSASMIVQVGCLTHTRRQRS
ncbi:MAG: hypothetical protein HYZ71_13580 [Deltaproteobacteria bacterium]|nr:hypothetical protein [Deltaproteobacteria bacterium]